MNDRMYSETVKMIFSVHLSYKFSVTTSPLCLDGVTESHAPKDVPLKCLKVQLVPLGGILSKQLLSCLKPAGDSGLDTDLILICLMEGQLRDHFKHLELRKWLNLHSC